MRKFIMGAMVASAIVATGAAKPVRATACPTATTEIPTTRVATDARTIHLGPP